MDEEIFFTQRQLEQMSSEHRVKRKISSEEDLLWPGGMIYYEFDGTHCKYSPLKSKSLCTSLCYW